MALPPPESYAVFMERIRCLQALHDCSVTSAGRTAARNRAVGGALTSKHQLQYGCMGADLVPDNDTKEKRRMVVHDAHRLGLWAVDEDDHVHTQGLAPTLSRRDERDRTT